MIAIPTAADVADAARRLAPWVMRTPVVRVEGPGARPMVLKLEGMQRSGSFKLRGALNTLMDLAEEARRGVVTASGGNHGLGVTYAGWLRRVEVHVFVPANTRAAKVEALERAAARVHRIKGVFADAEKAARIYAEAENLPFIHPYDDPSVIAGQGTAIAELIADAPEVKTIVIGIGGGGLAAGAVLAAGGRKVIGVEPYGAPTMHAALRAGEPVWLPNIQSIAADALGASQVGQINFDICRRGLDRVELVEDLAIVEAQQWLWQQLRLVYEPGGVTGLAALATGALDADPGPIGVLLCGANVDPASLGGSL